MKILPTIYTLTLLTALLLAALHAAAEPPAAVPQSVAELWADFDPRKDPLETEVIRQWKSDGVVLRHVRFLVGTFKWRPARMTAIYGFPEGAKEKLPAVLHIHGGGGRATLDEVTAMVGRGYAALSVNWGAGGGGGGPINAMEGAQPGDPNTDWGAVDPTQQNVPGYASMFSGPKQFYEDREHPKNNNWYLLTLGCRRGLTFLEQQPEVDPQRLGVYGDSMGGNLTMYVAGTDSRVKAAVPAIGGAGWRWQPHQFDGGIWQQDKIKGDVDVFRRTLSFESYATLIRCPVMHRSAANDHHGVMDDVYRTDALIQGQPVRHSWSPHLDHQLTPEVAVTMPLWFDHFLKGGPALPETPASELVLKTWDGTAEFRVSPKAEWPIARCDISYSVDSHPIDRFWRSADATRDGAVFTAKLPLESTGKPLLFAYANVYYTLPKPELIPTRQFRDKPITEVCLSTTFYSATPEELRAAGVHGTETANPLIEDFAHGWRDWHSSDDKSPVHWTRKISDPKWRGPDGAKLAITIKMEQTNQLCLQVIENEHRAYRGPRKTFACIKEVPGGPQEQTLLFTAADFVDPEDGKPLKSWTHLDQLGIGMHRPAMAKKKGNKLSAFELPKPKPWRGPEPEFNRLEWIGPKT